MADDPLSLVPLFEGGGEPWLPLLKPTLESLDGAATFIGPGRDKNIVPVRELTFQALKPNPPEKWNVVVFGQNPYPRVESATGIAMFDNAFGNWSDSQFGKVTSIRCIIKSAAMWKHEIVKATSTNDLRALLAKHQVVAPPGWFQAMLSQGVLLLNASLTASSDDSISTSKHTSFWKPVAQKIVEGIITSKKGAPAAHRGVVFAWWGSHAKVLRALVEKIAAKHPDVPVVHVDHCNPAAMGDAFCDGDPFGDINVALKKLGLAQVDWLPTVGAIKTSAAAASGEHERMGDFIQKTMDLHKLYLDRLQGVGDEKNEELQAITGISALSAPTLDEALVPLAKIVAGADFYLKQARTFVTKKRAANAISGGLSDDEAGAVFLYTTESPIYKKLNEALRHADRKHVEPWRAYLRLFLSGIAKLEAQSKSLWRGVALDLRAQYPLGGMVIWWGVSSCTVKVEVAKGFLGKKGRRMLFEVVSKSAVSIKPLSAFTGEEELVLAPGTRLKVSKVSTEPDGLTIVRLEESADARLVA